MYIYIYIYTYVVTVVTVFVLRLCLLVYCYNNSCVYIYTYTHFLYASRRLTRGDEDVVDAIEGGHEGDPDLTRQRFIHHHQ